ncbi:MAG TPA: leucyl aminopeptidase [Candidatus Hydrogenedentes bacterium]|nr:MAG: putative cytosol aminopeptidase [Candidatus Hydrogenedentes bacterium ADurb.Bin170]HOR51794.1 leucyl aminopeptidase [Candidatus Hydrogenedentota bacterium]HPK25917.1 leucyl aminopeptidase [Candidatus Hydrogenedentota bacterium]HPX86986.1 leucyl aminopeptidase [Candidatus Hydrogenedentota bacterium]HQB03719.1 leucyl aminopeptidase [Candidatus Hydrogenedentota bacterium]
MKLSMDMVTSISVCTAEDMNWEGGGNCLVVPLYRKEFPLNSALLQEEEELVLQALVDREVLTGAAGTCYYLPAPSRPYSGVLVLGLGDRKKATAESLRRAVGKAASLLKANRVERIGVDLVHFPELPVPAFVESLNLAQYRFDTYKKEEEKPAPAVREVVLVVADSVDKAALLEAAERAAFFSVAANGARHLANTASNDMTPAVLAAAAQKIAEEGGEQCTCAVLDQQRMEELGMNALLGVARGSGKPPQLICLEYTHPEATRTITLVGKGVTFDTGGISLKPGAKMHEMKFDMCGAAVVLATMMAVTRLKPVLNVISVVPAVENMPDGNAQTPGEIVRACNGKTIEVLNTDAEGRLILADALAYAVDTWKPDCIVDLATLTGAVVIALGHVAAGVVGSDSALVQSLVAAGESTGERLWELPLWEDYEEMMEGTFADLSNIGPEREAGTITGAAFLKAFTGDTPWAHIDIAGVSYGIRNKPYLKPEYATGFGVRLLLEWLTGRTAQSGQASE